MSDLLIHSRAEFAETILACLGAADAREIGAEFGGMSKRLAFAARITLEDAKSGAV